MENDMKIRNSVALVTGGNRGIGRALVDALIAAQAQRIYATARRLDDLPEVVKLDPKRVVALELDVTDTAAVNKVATLAKDVSVLFNNAGVLDFGGALDASEDAFRRNFDVNFYGALRMTRAFARPLTSNAGAV